MNNEQPIEEIQPVVVPAQYFVYGRLASGFISLFPGMFAFGISNMIARSFDPILYYGLAVYALSFAGAMYFFYLKFFIEPHKTTYRIFKNRLEYHEGFLNRQQRTVMYDKVIDVQLTEGLLQQTQAAGSITLITQQLISSGEGNLSNRRVVLKNIPKPQTVYDLLRNLVIDKEDKSKSEA